MCARLKTIRWPTAKCAGLLANGSWLRSCAWRRATQRRRWLPLKACWPSAASASPLASPAEKHANFIVNDGSATAGDIEALIRHVARTVEERQGVRLVTEVHIVGEAP